MTAFGLIENKVYKVQRSLKKSGNLLRWSWRWN